METLRTRRIQQPAVAEQLLQDFVQKTGGIPDRAHRVLHFDDLPGDLQPIVTVATRAGQSWSGWTDDDEHVWLFTAEVLLSLAAERGGAVLQVHVYREDGHLKGSGLWVSDEAGQWLPSPSQ